MLFRSVTFIRTSAAQSGVSSAEIRKWRTNVVTRYEFQQGMLRGLSVGGALRWQDRVGIGYPNISATPNTQYVPDIAHPLYGPRDTQVDLSLGYRSRLRFRGTNLPWTIGVNVRNLNAKETLIPIAANPDGSWATFRIPPERTWSVSSSLAF